MLKVQDDLGAVEVEWMVRQYMNKGVLIARGCQSLAILEGLPFKCQKSCYELAKNILFSWHAYIELEIYKSDYFEGSANSVSAPFLFHLKADSARYESFANLLSCTEHEKKEMFTLVCNGPGTSETEKLLRSCVTKEFQELDNFPDGHGKSEIEKMLTLINN